MLETRLADIADLNNLIEPEARALGFDLVRVKLFGAGEDRTFQIMAERPETRQLTIDDCAALSRRISERLDELEAAGRDPIEGAYRLEVSSPGIDRPLTRPKDFTDWSGHEARITVEEGIEGRKTFKGVLTGFESDIVLLKDAKVGDVAIAFSNINGAKLVLTDALISATIPLSSDGADEILNDNPPETPLG